MERKPHLSFWQIWNMCFGFLGIQFAFALQNGSMSRIFQTLGADMEQLPLLWIAAAAKPAYDHMYFQYRGLGVTLFAGIVFLLGTAFPSGRYTAAADDKRS